MWSEGSLWSVYGMKWHRRDSEGMKGFSEMKQMGSERGRLIPDLRLRLWNPFTPRNAESPSTFVSLLTSVEGLVLCCRVLRREEKSEMLMVVEKKKFSFNFTQTFTISDLWDLNTQLVFHSNLTQSFLLYCDTELSASGIMKHTSETFLTKTTAVFHQILVLGVAVNGTQVTTATTCHLQGSRGRKHVT